MDSVEVSFLNDIIQDSRVDAITTTKYATLINTIFNNAEINYTGDGLRFKYDEIVFNVLRALEPESYDETLKKLLKEKENKIEE